MRCRGKVDTRAHSYRIIVTPPGWLTWGSVRSWQMRDGAQALELWSQPTGRIGVPQLSYAICRGGRCNNYCERPGKRPPHYKQVELQYSGSATVDSGQARSGRLGIVDARPRRVAMATGARSRGAPTVAAHPCSRPGRHILDAWSRPSTSAAHSWAGQLCY